MKIQKNISLEEGLLNEIEKKAQKDNRRFNSLVEEALAKQFSYTELLWRIVLYRNLIDELKIRAEGLSVYLSHPDYSNESYDEKPEDPRWIMTRSKHYATNCKFTYSITITKTEVHIEAEIEGVSQESQNRLEEAYKSLPVLDVNGFKIELLTRRMIIRWGYKNKVDATLAQNIFFAVQIIELYLLLIDSVEPMF